MRASVGRRLLIVCTILTILAMPVVGYAQEATLAGAVTDSTGGVLPGVAVKAENEASGNTFDTVTDTNPTQAHALELLERIPKLA